MTDCKQFKREIYRHLDGEPQDPRTEAHLETCVSCRQEAETARALDGLLHKADVKIEPSAGFDAVFWEKLTQRQRGSWWGRAVRELQSFVPAPNLAQAVVVLSLALFIGGAGGAVSAMNAAVPVEAQAASVRYLSGFREFKGVPSASVAGTYLQAFDERGLA